MNYETMKAKMKMRDRNYKYLSIFIIILTALVFSASAYGAGGDMLWEYGITPQTGKQEAQAMTVDSSGNTIITGFSDQSGSLDYYTVKINASGNTVLWDKTYDPAGGNDYAKAIALDSDDNVIVTGYIFNGTNYDYYTVKYASSNGAVLWEHTFNAAEDGNDYATSIAVDSLNNVYVGGNSQGANGADDFMIVKYGPDGPNPDDTPIWEMSYNGTANGHDRINSITAGIDGIAVTGMSQNSTPDFDALTIKYGFDSTFIWERRKSVSGDDFGIAAGMDSSGNVIMTGVTNNGTDKDIYIAKYNTATGVEDWEDTVDAGYDDEPAGIFVDSIGDAYITGYSFVLLSAHDAYTAKYNGGTGVQEWSHTYNSINGNSDYGTHIIVDESGDLFVTGYLYYLDGDDDNFLTLKYKKESGSLLWDQAYNGTGNEDDRAAGIGIAPSGDVIVAGFSDMWTSGATDFDYYAIKYDPGLLDPPTSLTASTFSTTQIDLSWTDNSSNETGFKIERKIGDFGTFAQIDTVTADTTAYNDDNGGSGLAPETQYYYRVRAYNVSDGDSYYSNEAYAVTSIVTFTAPSLTYSYSGSDNGDDYLTDVAAGPDYNPVITGFSYSLAGQFDYYTVKLDRSLAFVWDAVYDSDQNDMDVAITVGVDENNDVLVSGYSMMYGGGAENTNDIYSIKYPSAGPPEEWADQYNGPAGDDDRSSVVDISRDGNNNYAVVGYGRNANWDDDIYVIKYLSDGTRDWEAVPYDGGVMNHDYPAAVTFDSAGDIIVAGYTHNGSDYDFFVRKYSGTDGAPVWTDVYDINGGNDYIRGIAKDALDNIYVTGLAVTVESGNEDFYTIKYDGTNGNRIWEKFFNGLGNDIDEAVGIAIDPANNDVLVAGTTLVSSGNNDIHIIRYGYTDGSIVWIRTLDRPGDNDFAVDMSIDLTGNIHVSGDTDDGLQRDIISVMYDYDGNFAGGAIYNGSANADDGAAAVAVNRLGEAFVGGYETNASFDADYIVFKVTNNFLQAPSPLSAAIHYTQADLYWFDNSLVEDGYHLERKLGTCDGIGTWTPVQTFLPDTTSYIDDTLSIGASYCYRVRIFDTESGGTSRWAEKEVTTTSPVAPSGLTATAINTTDIDLAWTDNTTLEDGFIIQRCTGSGTACDEDSEFADIDTVVSDTTTYTDAAGCESGTYTYRVKAYRTARWTTGYSNTDAATTTTLPAASSLNIAAQRMTEAEIVVSWTAAAADETDYSIERCDIAVCTGGDFTEIALMNVSSFIPGIFLNMDEASWNGTTDEVIDSSGNDNHGTAAGGANTVAGGRFGRAGSFNSSGHYVDVGSIDLGSDWTIETWFQYPLASPASWNTLTRGTSADHQVIVQRSTLLLGTYDNGGGGFRSSGFYMNTLSNGWHHLVAVGSGSSTKYYIDGQVSGTSSYKSTSDIRSVGNYWGGGQQFGTIDDFAVYSRVLSDLEIQEHYTSGISPDARYYSDTGLDPDNDYTYRMKSLKNATCNWETIYSSEVTANTTLNAPDGLSATPIDTTRVDLAWTDNTYTETGFIIERCPGSGAACDEDAEFTEIDTVLADIISYSDTTVCEGQTYTYRVRADRDTAPVWQSGWSSPSASAATPSISANSPDTLIAAAASESDINIEWTSHTSDETGFSIERCTGAGCSDFTEIATLDHDTDALLLMAMDETQWTGAADEVADTSRQNNHGMAYGGVTTIAEGYYGRAGSFDGSNDYVETNLFLNQTSGAAGVTMEAWVYPTNTNSGRHQLISTDNGGYDWGLLRNGATWTVYTGSGEFSTGLSVDLNQWQHVAAVFTPGSGITFYKNGTETASTSTIGYDSNTVGIVIGRRSVGGENFAGRIDEVAVYNRPLNAAEIESHFAVGVQAGTTKRFRDTGLTPEITYQYRVSAYKNSTCP